MAGDDGVESPRFCLPAEEGKLGGGIAENARVGSYTDEFDEGYRRIAEEITIL